MEINKTSPNLRFMTLGMPLEMGRCCYRYPQKVSGMVYGSLWYWVWVYHIIATIMENDHVGCWFGDYLFSK